MHRLRLVLVAVMATTVGACASDDIAATDPATNVPDDAVTVVATTSIIGDIVAEIVGDAAQVEVLMGPGVDPHAYAPSAAQAQTLREADLIVANGLHLEESLLDTIDAARQDGVPVIELGPEVDPIAYERGGAPDDDGADHAMDDPHIWLDAGRMADATGVIVDAIAAVDDVLDDDEWESRGEAYAEQLQALDDELRETLAAIPDGHRQLVTNHMSFGYWADAYDFEVVGTVIPGDTTQLDTSAADFAALVETIRATGVSAIFSESTSSTRLAEAVAEEVGRDIEIVQLHSGALDEPDSDAGTYIGLMRSNAQLMVAALAN